MVAREGIIHGVLPTHGRGSVADHIRPSVGLDDHAINSTNGEKHEDDGETAEPHLA